MLLVATSYEYESHLSLLQCHITYNSNISKFVTFFSSSTLIFCFAVHFAKKKSTARRAVVFCFLLKKIFFPFYLWTQALAKIGWVFLYTVIRLVFFRLFFINNRRTDGCIVFHITIFIQKNELQIKLTWKFLKKITYKWRIHFRFCNWITRVVKYLCCTPPLSNGR